MVLAKRSVLRIRAPRRGLHEITSEVREVVGGSGVGEGMCNLFVRHTSASLIINENADPTARADLESFLDRLVPRDASWYRHTLEGPDDMPSHIRSILTDVSLSIPVEGGRLALGTWQGIYLFEHRDRPSTREIVVTVY
jgi:secondary thiamine-phosphate synthase enzyme